MQEPITPNTPQKRPLIDPNSDKPANSGAAPQQQRPGPRAPFLDVTGKPSEEQEINTALEFLRRNKWAIRLIFFALIVIAVVAFFIFRAPGTPPTPRVTVSVSAPNQSTSGKEVVYTVKFANNDTSTIKNITVDMLYPAGFTFEESAPPPATISGTEFTVASVDPQQGGVITIKGLMIGNAGETKTAQALMHYNFSNFNSNFVAQGQAQTNIVGSNVALAFDGQTKINNNQSITYTLNYTNSTDHALSNVQLQLTVPNAFQNVVYQPQPDTGSNIWTIPKLDVGATGSIQITGSFQGAQVGDQELFSAQAIGSDNGQSVVLSNATDTVGITLVPLEIDTAAIVSGGSSGIVSPGDTITYTLHYKNNNNIPLTGVVIQANISGVIADLTSILADKGVINGAQITWDGSQVADLNTLQPTQEGMLSLNVKVKNPATTKNLKNLSLTLSANIKSNEFQQGFQAPDYGLKLRTTASIDVSVAHNGGAYPMHIGQQTTFLVTVNLHNSTNDIDNTAVTLNLPRITDFDASTVNVAERGNVTYAANTRKITWNVGTLQAHSGDFNALRQLQFTVAVTPNSTDSNAAMTLVSNIAANGTDTFASLPVNLTIPDLKTTDDPSGSGTVQP